MNTGSEYGLVVDRADEMVNISLACNHTPSRSSNRHAFERPPSNWTAIPSLVESMDNPQQ